MAQIIEFKEKEPKCSFCGVLKSKAKHMLESYDKTEYICDVCLAHATKRMKEESEDAAE